MTQADISIRIAAIEAEVAALKASVSDPPSSHPSQAVDRIHAVFPDDDALGGSSFGPSLAAR
jgi:hypothetical protein